MQTKRTFLYRGLARAALTNTCLPDLRRVGYRWKEARLGQPRYHAGRAEHRTPNGWLNQACFLSATRKLTLYERGREIPTKRFYV